MIRFQLKYKPHLYNNYLVDRYLLTDYVQMTSYHAKNVLIQLITKFHVFILIHDSFTIQYLSFCRCCRLVLGW